MKKERDEMKYTHVVVTQRGGPQVLQLREDKLPDPKAGEVRIKILATESAFGDILERQGKAVGAKENRKDQPR
jgi:NADPH:quinone reductase-like Zn-dependent oxidoreductase